MDLLKLPGGYSGALWSIEVPAVCPHGCLAEGLTERSVAFHCAEQCLLTDAACPLEPRPGLSSACTLSKLTKGSLAHHTSNCCAERLVECVCGNPDIRAFELELHLKDDCPRRVVQCPECSQSMQARALPAHQKDLCDARPTQCLVSKQCSAMPPANLAAAHADVCPYREVACTVCGLQGILAKDLTEHKLEICASRLVACERGCRVELPANQMEEHAEVCPQRVVECPNRCGIADLKRSQVTFNWSTVIMHSHAQPPASEFDPPRTSAILKCASNIAWNSCIPPGLSHTPSTIYPNSQTPCICSPRQPSSGALTGRWSGTWKTHAPSDKWSAHGAVAFLIYQLQTN